MSLVDDPVVGSPPGMLSDAEVIARCRDIERRRRADLAEHVAVLAEIERRQLHVGDGHRDLAAFGRAELRWSDRDAKLHRDLERLARRCPQVAHQLALGRLGTAQAFLLARTARAPRVGRYVVEQIDDFLEQAAQLSYVQFEQYVLAWRYLMDADGPDPDRAHRRRTATWSQSGLTGIVHVEGPAIDLARLRTLMARFEDVEFRRDWDAATAVWGDDVNTSRLSLSASQRRYDAFQNLLDHVDLTQLPSFPDQPDDEPEENTAEGEGVAAPEPDATEASSDDPAGTACGACRRRADTRRSPVGTVVNVVVDGDSFLHGLELLLGLSTSPLPVRSPFGPRRALCQTFDGDPIGLRDAVVAALAGKVRVALRGDDGVPVRMSSASRLFTGALRDAVLLTATHCTHPGCTVPATRSQIDHLRPASCGGRTEVRNGTPGCAHHNWWRYAAGVTVVRLPDGTMATFRRDGTRIGAPD